MNLSHGRATVTALALLTTLPLVAGAVATPRPEIATRTPTAMSTVDPSSASGPPSDDASRTVRVEYQWPTGGEAPVAAPFSAPPQRWLPGHRGVDLHAGSGATILAPADGLVAFRGTIAGRPVLSIDHADGVRTSYEPVDSGLTVGESVRAGEPIGTLGIDVRGDGDAGPHRDGVLHWGAREREGGGEWSYIDPLSLLGDRIIRLLPRAGRG